MSRASRKTKDDSETVAKESIRADTSTMSASGKTDIRKEDLDRAIGKYYKPNEKDEENINTKNLN